jgi:hypothetical protein
MREYTRARRALDCRGPREGQAKGEKGRTLGERKTARRGLKREE